MRQYDTIELSEMLEPQQHPELSETKWYERSFGPDYLKVYPHRDSQEAMQHVRFALEKTNIKAPSLVLDVGCGFGRHSMGLSELGFEPVGLDLSMSLLKKARTESMEIKTTSSWVRGDMRTLPFNNSFHAAFNFFTSFGYFDDAENERVLSSIYSILKPNGKFFFDYMNIDYVIPRLVRQDIIEKNGIKILQQRRFNADKKRIEKKISLKENGDWRYYFESVRAYSRKEIDLLFRRTGFKNIATFGDYGGKPYSANSPRLICIGEKGDESC